jgi:hypothetical protein
MIRHTVMFTLASSDESQREQDVTDMRSRLNALVGTVPGLVSISLNRDLGLVAAGHWDVVLVSEHDDNASLEGYQSHPDHQSAGAFIRSVTVDRATVDYEY